MISVMKLNEIYEMAKHGLNGFEIRSALGLSEAEMAENAALDAMTRGRAEGIKVIADKMYAAASNGRNIGASKYYLTAVAGRGGTDEAQALKAIVAQPQGRSDEAIIAHAEWCLTHWREVMDGVKFENLTPEPKE